MAMDFDWRLGDDVDADEDPDLWQNMDVQRHPGVQWLITGGARGRRDDANVIGAELARIWENRLRYRHRGAHHRDRARPRNPPSGDSDRAGRLRVTATVQMNLA